jgi:hypothetical protein
VHRAQAVGDVLLSHECTMQLAVQGLALVGARSVMQFHDTTRLAAVKSCSTMVQGQKSGASVLCQLLVAQLWRGLLGPACSCNMRRAGTGGGALCVQCCWAWTCLVTWVL